MDKAIKSILYLAGFTSLGLMLMKITEPDKEKIEAIKGTRYSDPQSDENRRKTELILKKLQESANLNKPQLKTESKD